MSAAVLPAARSWPRSIGAVVVGILANVVIALPIDFALHAFGIYPAPGGEPMSNALCALAFSYRVVAAVVGGYLTAWIAPQNPRKHTVVLGWIGTALATTGAIAMWGVGPAWYPLALIAIAVPASAWGGSLFAANPDRDRSA